ncbi:hypothetical protein D3C83_325970 [compost metagenome]
MPARASGVNVARLNVFGVAPVLMATYCLPFTANVAGKPLTCEPKFTSHSTAPVSAS